MKVLLYLMYGSGRAYHLELTYSVLSAARFLSEGAEGVQIVLASDAANQRTDLPVTPLVLTPEQLHDWQFGGSYHHAVKPQVLAHAIRETGAPVALIDTDTVLHAHPGRLFDRISAGISLMHDREWTLGQAPNRNDWQMLIADCGGALGGYPIDDQTVMHNSGVLGVDPSNVDLLEGSVRFMRAMRKHSDLFNAEQLAASVALGTRTTVAGCADLVEHYWEGPRAYYRYQMAKMFPDVAAGNPLAKVPVLLPPLQAAPTAALRDRVMARLIRAWRRADGAYGHAVLAARAAVSCQRTDPALANVWATIACNALIYGAARHPVPADFAAFTPQSLPRLSWMDDHLRDRWRRLWVPDDAEVRRN